jgi:uncharacterized protein
MPRRATALVIAALIGTCATACRSRASAPGREGASRDDESGAGAEHCDAACRLGHSNSCARAGEARAARDPAGALGLYQRACTGGSGIGCEDAAVATATADPTAAAALFARARFYHRVHCEQGFAPSCLGLSRMFADGRGGPTDAGAAEAFRQKACARGLESACGPAR